MRNYQELFKVGKKLTKIMNNYPSSYIEVSLLLGKIAGLQFNKKGMQLYLRILKKRINLRVFFTRQRHLKISKIWKDKLVDF